MRLATHDSHDPNCSGCPICSEEMAAIMDRPYDNRHHDAMRRAAARNGTVRRVVRAAVRKDYTPPDPYAKATAKAPPPPCPFNTPGYTGTPRSLPPDPYKAGLDRMREQQKKEEL